MLPHVDVIIVFRAFNKPLSKKHAIECAQRAELQYTRLLKTLDAAGLRAVGRKGEKQGHLLVLVSCPLTQLASLIRQERRSDFLHGLPLSKVAGAFDPQNLSPGDRLRLVHGYVTSTAQDGGLGIIPESADWDMVESVMALHDREFNETWIRSWTTRQLASVKLGRIREQFGDSVALYFAFLSCYTGALIFPAALGAVFYLLGDSYSAFYSTLLLVWSVSFVEWWRVQERILSLRWGTRGSFRVEKRRAQYSPGLPWWKRELRMLASVPVILLFAGILTALLTAIFVFEAFVTQLYTGPGYKYVSFSPTILFIALVPRVLAIYQASASRFTAWENHAHQSTHAASLTLKTFALTSIVAYLGLSLSAFIYVPFGAEVMQYVQGWLFDPQRSPFLVKSAGGVRVGANATGPASPAAGMWDASSSSAVRKLNPRRLRDQMFAYTVTNQVINTFVEVGLPFVLRFVFSAKGHGGSGKKKRVVFEDEVGNGTGVDVNAKKEEREFLEGVRKEVALPDYELFGDYNEMVTQFGYIALWSTIWPLAPVMALANNFLELRSDAFKITVHNRRPIPTRTDTIGPWLDALTFLTWLAALTNSSLVYLFRPSHAMHGTASARELLMPAVLIALGASHGYLLIRALVRHVVERVVWKGSLEVEEREKSELEVKERYLKSLEEISGSAGDGASDDLTMSAVKVDKPADDLADAFWDHDEGLEEIRKIGKHE